MPSFHSISPTLENKLSSQTGQLKTYAILCLVTLLPTSIFYILGTSSQAVGVAIMGVILLMGGASGLIGHPNTKQMIGGLLLIGCAMMLILAHGIFASYFEALSVIRMLSSLALLAIMVVSAFVLRFALFTQGDATIDKAVSWLFFTFIFVGVMGILGVRPLESVTAVNPVFPFTEPSHYALTFTPIMLYFCVTRDLTLRLIGLLGAMAIAYLLQSLSLVTAALLVAAATLPLIYLIAGGAIFFLGVGILDVTYFADRLDLNYDSGNLSVLVYIQGWELALDSLSRTSGWGIGFQQLGFGSINSPTADIIFRLAGNDTNLKDGGFTMAKTISEFGIFGIALMGVFSAVVGRIFLQLRKISLRRIDKSRATVLAMCVVCGYAVEAFVRGIGYFSGSTMLLFASLIYLSAQNQLSTDEAS